MSRTAFASVGVAAKVLGKHCVISVSEAGELWPASQPGKALFPVTWAMLEEAAKQNAVGSAMWRVSFDPGLSPWAMNKAVEGLSPGLFDADMTWWLDSKNVCWADQERKPQYHLVNMAGQFQSSVWSRQESEIKALGLGYYRPSFGTIAAITYGLLRVHAERLLPDSRHWSSDQTEDGDYVSFGPFADHGGHVHSYHPKGGDLNIVCVGWRNSTIVS